MTSGDLNTNGTKIPTKFEQKEFDRIYTKLADLYSDISIRMDADINEKRLILERLTEAGMWLKMAFDMENPSTPELKMDLKVTPKENQQ